MPWGRFPHQCDQLTPVRFGQSARPSTARSVAQPEGALGIEAVQATPHCLRTTLQLPGDGLHSLPIPTARHHARMDDPVCRSVSACRQLLDLVFFLFILCGSCSQDLWHLLAPFCLYWCLLSYSIIT